MKRLLSTVLGALLFVLCFSTPVFAIANPGSISIGDVYVFEDVLETGDVLVYMRYNVAYASQPSEDSEATFQMAVYGIDGTTLIAARPLNYYQENIISIYLGASTNTLTSGGAYFVRVMGNPTIFAMEEGVTMATRVLSSGDWYTAESLGGAMLAQAAILETDWGTTLLSSTDKLNATGSTYFQKAIPNLPTMAPEIFSTTTSTFSYTNTTWNNTGLNLTKDNLPTSVNSATTGLDAMFGITNHNWGQFGWAFLMALMIGSVVYGATRRPDIAFLGGTMSACGLEAYLGIANGNMLLFVMSVGAIIIVWFSVEFLIPKVG